MSLAGLALHRCCDTEHRSVLQALDSMELSDDLPFFIACKLGQAACEGADVKSHSQGHPDRCHIQKRPSRGLRLLVDPARY